MKLIDNKIKETSSKGNVQASLKRIKGIIKDWNLGINCKATQDPDTEILRMELDELCLVRDSMLKQKVRISWLKDGDRNTKKFHHSIHRRRSRNNIRKIIHKGNSILDPVEIKQAFLQHYKAQFSKRKLT